MGRSWDWDSTKSPRANRKIDLAPTLKKALRDHKLASHNKSSSSLVLCNPRGEPLRRQIYNELMSIFRGAGVERVLHECRNLYGSVLLSTGSDLYFCLDVHGA